MKNFETKSIAATVADVDDKTRRVKVAMSEMGSKDLDDDVIDQTAYAKTIKERGPKGVNLIWHLTDHYPSLQKAVGKPSEILTDANKLVFVTTIAKTSWGDDVMEMYKTGLINQHSIGFRTIKSEPVNAGKPDEYRLIKEVLLYEGSAVLWAANPNTPTLSVGKSLTKEQAGKDFFDTLKELNNLAKVFKSGHFTDDTFELLEMHMIQKTEKLEQLFQTATQPAANAVEPEQGKGLLEVLTTFNHSLILQHESRRIKTAIG